MNGMVYNNLKSLEALDVVRNILKIVMLYMKKIHEKATKAFICRYVLITMLNTYLVWSNWIPYVEYVRQNQLVCTKGPF